MDLSVDEPTPRSLLGEVPRTSSKTSRLEYSARCSLHFLVEISLFNVQVKVSADRGHLEQLLKHVFRDAKIQIDLSTVKLNLEGLRFPIVPHGLQVRRCNLLSLQLNHLEFHRVLGFLPMIRQTRVGRGD